MVGAVTTGGVVVGGVVVGAGAAVNGVVGGVVVVVWATDVGLIVVAWEFDMKPSPKASPPATRTASTAMRIPNRLVTSHPFKLCGLSSLDLSRDFDTSNFNTVEVAREFTRSHKTLIKKQTVQPSAAYVDM